MQFLSILKSYQKWGLFFLYPTFAQTVSVDYKLNRNKDSQGSDTMSQSGKFTNAYRCNGCLSKDVLRCCRTSIGVEKYIEDILKTFGSIETPFTVSQLHVLQKLF